MEKDAKPSSRVTDFTFSGYDQVIRPEVDFAYSYDIYKTIGIVQNVVESFVSEIMSRDWYYIDKNLEEKRDRHKKALSKKVKQLKSKQQASFLFNTPPQQQEAFLVDEIAKLAYEADELDNAESPGVQTMNEWEEEHELSRIMEYWVRDMLVCGTSITGTTDWQPVQMDSMVGLKRDQYGKVLEFIQQSNGRWFPLPLKVDDYVVIHYIEMGRKAWSLGLFHALTTTFTDMDGQSSVAPLEIYRRHIQNMAKIETRYASPVVVWAYENLDQRAYDQMKVQLDDLRPGDRRITTRKPELISETVDGRSALIGSITPILDKEVEAGLQSSANRVITMPSAMADAREAGEKDDTRTLGIMEKIRRVMNKEIIPRVLGEDSGIEFVWGTQDDFEIEMPPGVIDAVKLGLIAKEEGREILKTRGWKLDDNAWVEENNAKQQMFAQHQQMALQKGQQPPTAADKVETEPAAKNPKRKRGPRNGAPPEAEDESVDESDEEMMARMRIETVKANLEAAQEKVAAAKIVRKGVERLRKVDDR